MCKSYLNHQILNKSLFVLIEGSTLKVILLNNFSFIQNNQVLLKMKLSATNSLVYQCYYLGSACKIDFSLRTS